MIGRPRKHKSNAAKQDAYRRRKQDQERRALVDQIVMKTPVPTGMLLETIEQGLAGLSIRKLKEKLREFRNKSNPVLSAKKARKNARKSFSFKGLEKAKHKSKALHASFVREVGPIEPVS